MSAPSYRLTVAAAYRSGSEVLLHDSGSLPDLGAVRDALASLDAAFDRHGDLIASRGAELIVRVAERQFERFSPPRVRLQKRVRSESEF